MWSVLCKVLSKKYNLFRKEFRSHVPSGRGSSLRPENKDKKIGTSTETFYIGKPSPIDFDEGMEILKNGFEKKC
jgi:hypothetical protein